MIDVLQGLGQFNCIEILDEAVAILVWCSLSKSGVLLNLLGPFQSAGREGQGAVDLPACMLSLANSQLVVSDHHLMFVLIVSSRVNPGTLTCVKQALQH